MNTVTGKILVAGSGAGIPDLLVTVYDADRAAFAEFGIAVEEANPPVTAFSNRLRGHRLGSVLTDQNGTFLLRYADCDFRHEDGEKRPDLMLFVTGPETHGSEGCAPVLHVSCGIRRSAARTESFIIRIAPEQLKAAGLGALLPSALTDSEVVARAAELSRRNDKIKNELRGLLRERVTKEKQRRDVSTKRFGGPDRLLSKFSSEAREQINYVASGDDVQQRALRVMQTAITGTHEQSTTTGLLSLTAAQKSLLQDESGNYQRGVRSTTFNNIVFQSSKAPIDATRLNPLYFCRQHKEPDDICTGGPARPSPPAGAPAALPAAGEAPAIAQLSTYIATLIGGMTAPEMSVQLQAGTRATQDVVQSTINDLTLKGGPADTPALYDFHQLQIAFPYVWQEAFDTTTYDLVSRAYDHILDLTGVAPGGSGTSDSLLEGVIGTLLSILNLVTSEIPVQVSQVFDITPQQWMALSQESRARLALIASAYLQALGAAPPAGWTDSIDDTSTMPDFARALAHTVAQAAVDPKARTAAQRLRQMGQQLIRHADTRATDAGRQSFDELHYLLQRLEERLREPYTFTLYAAGTVNFGVLATYRQWWIPLNYQAGELAKTITLAPKETRKFSKKTNIKTRRSEKEVTNNLRSRKDESSETVRAESEIIRRASSKTNFNLTTENTFDLLLASGKMTTSTTREAAQASDEVKRDFREAVFKAAQEYKEERSTEVLSEFSQDIEAEESGEINNPNDELPVTFLFYELQRRYSVTEKIHRVRPVIFVAQQIPSPAAITEEWLVEHDWILHRVILDDSFLPALTYLGSRLSGDEFALEEKKKNLELQRDMVDALKEEIAAFRSQAGQRYTALERSMQRRADIVEEEESEGFFESLGEGIFGGDESEEAARMREEAAKDAHERAAQQEKEARARLEPAITALEAATELYTKTLAEHVNRRAQISRLRVHVKQNILYYMQAIWAHEPPDQRFFRLQAIQAPRLTGELIYNFQNLPGAPPRFPTWEPPVQFTVECCVDQPLENAPLAELADLDNLLGFKGNYMIFPLKAGNCLTDFMMAPYVDSALGVTDPDEFGNWTLEEFSEYVCCLKQHMTTEAFAEIRGALQNVFRRLLSAPRRGADEIVVPTGSLFIEALPGTHPILEDFKLKHRATDVKKAQAEVRKAELENLRCAARLLVEELDDPDIDKRIRVEGASAVMLSE